MQVPISPLIQPTDELPLPFNMDNEQPQDDDERVRVAADTAAMLAELGMPLEYSAKDEAAARDLLLNAPTAPHPTHAFKRGIATKLAGLLHEYDHQVVKDAVQLRTYVTHKLIEISDCGDARYELKALELLGKVTDVGLFSEKSEITITHKTSGDLENAIKDRIKKLLGAQVIDMEPLGANLDEELGLFEQPEEPEDAEEVTEASTIPPSPPGELNMDEELGVLGQEPVHASEVNKVTADYNAS